MWKPWDDSISNYIENLRNHLLLKPLTDCKKAKKYQNFLTPIDFHKVKLVYHDWIKNHQPQIFTFTRNDSTRIYMEWI